MSFATDDRVVCSTGKFEGKTGRLAKAKAETLSDGGTREATVGSVGSSNLKDGPAAESEARAEEETEGSAGGGRQPGNRQSGRKVRLEGWPRDASQNGRGRKAEAGSSVEGASRSAERKARLKGRTRRRKPNGEAGRQIRKRGSGRKLTNSVEGEAERLGEGASRTSTRKQNRRSNRRRKLTGRSKERPEGRL
jgi:hypothetical protein